MIEAIGGGDQFAYLVVRDDDVARLPRIRQTGQTDFPRLPVLNPLVMMSCQLQGSEQASADSIDRGRRELAKQAITPFFQLVRVEELHRLGKQHASQMNARRFSI